MERKSTTQGETSGKDRGRTAAVIRYLAFFSFALVLIFSSCKTYIHLQEIDGQRYRVDADLPVDQDPDIEAILKPYREQMQEEMTVVVGYLDNDLIKRQPEGTLGNFVADAILEQANTIHPEKVDFAVQNNGGIRVGALSRGGVTKGRVFELMPFDNLVVVIKADSALVHKFCDHMAKGSGWPVSRNIRFQIDGDVAVHIEVNGAPLSDDQTYVFATNDYIVNGGDHCGFLEEDALELYRYDKLIRDLIIDHLKENFPKEDPAQVVMEGRITRL